MKVFTAEKIRQGDQYTIENEPIESINLMERAARQCASWISAHFQKETIFYIFCGVGNNAGDGFALARILSDQGFKVYTYTVLFSRKFSEDCRTNKEKFEAQYPDCAINIHDIEDFPPVAENIVIIDSLFGTGMNRPLKGFLQKVVQRINTLDNKVISIDMPSGLQAEDNPLDQVVIRANHTLSFEFCKLAFLFKENAPFVGHLHVLSIGIHPDYIRETATPYQLTTAHFIDKNLKKRTAFTHKGTYGHALLMAGSYGKMGAAILTTKANIKSGAGLTTVYSPRCGYSILQSTVPEAMCMTDVEDHFFSQMPKEDFKPTVYGIGPGIGTQKETQQFLLSVLKKSVPMVIDADALNILSKNPSFFSDLPEGSILTPHPKEFERMFGKTTNSYERLQLQRKKSKALNTTILLKGHHTSISNPKGQVWFNTTGHAGMATGGSGDVLTGLITGLLAQGYSAPKAAVLGAWLHGKSGDLALQTESMESMTASTLIHYFGKAFNAGHMKTETLQPAQSERP